MSYHDGNPRLQKELRRRQAPSPLAHVRDLAKVYVFKPAQPKLPRGTTFVQVLRHEGKKVVMDAYDARKRLLGRVKAPFFQTGPVTQSAPEGVWWTEGGYYGPIVTQETVLGPVRMPPPPAVGRVR